MSKKKTQKFYVFVTNRDGCICDNWPEVQQLLKDFEGRKLDSRVLGGYDTFEEAEAVLGAYLRTIILELQNSAPVLTPYFTGERPGRALDVYACGVYKFGKYGGGFVVFEGETLMHSGKLANPHNSVKGSGKWAGLFHAILHGTRWAKENGADSVLIHTNTTGPAELVAGVHKPGKEITKDFVAAMVPFRESARFAPIPEEPDEGLKHAERLANEAAGLVES